MKTLNLVLGANGHLGNNLVRELVSKGEYVRASVRSSLNAATLDGLDCEIVVADLMNKKSLINGV